MLGFSLPCGMETSKSRKGQLKLSLLALFKTILTVNFSSVFEKDRVIHLENTIEK